MALADSNIVAVAARTESSSDYQVREVRLQELPSASLAAWKMRNIQYNNDILHCDPEWLQEQFKGEEDKLHVFLVEKDGELAGAVPFDLTQRPLKCLLGEFQVAEFPLRRLRLLGYSLSLPTEAPIYDMLFSKVLATAGQFDAIFMEYVSADSFLWNYLHTSPLIRKHLRYFSRVGPMPHPIIRLSGSFDDYMQKFSSKTRNTLRRKLKRLRERGSVEFLPCTEAKDVDSFLDAAAAISRKTWQFKIMGWGLAAWDLARSKHRLGFAAQRDWLRSYLLKCGGAPCSYLVGLQHSGRFYHAVLGYDSEWEELSVGTVLQLLVLEDLFNHNKPEVYDFATYAPYKEHWSTDSYPEDSILLFPRRPYTMLAQTVYWACCATSIRAAALLDRVHLKPAVRQLIRRIRG